LDDGISCHLDVIYWFIDQDQVVLRELIYDTDVAEHLTRLVVLVTNCTKGRILYHL